MTSQQLTKAAVGLANELVERKFSKLAMKQVKQRCHDLAIPYSLVAKLVAE